uniref:Uncharacterized protein n=1 Tax=Populus alba TaxID=43335 RepID=A0A4U5Q5D1_POPAL|nr:hypothetical protein D5086_0000137750 [Populus alba]
MDAPTGTSQSMVRPGGLKWTRFYGGRYNWEELEFGYLGSVLLIFDGEFGADSLPKTSGSTARVVEVGSMSGGGISGSKDPFSSLVDLNESETRWCCASNKWFQGIKYEFQVQYWMTLERSTIAFLLRSSRHRFNLQLVIRFDMFFHTFLGKCYQQYLEDLGGQPLSEVKMIGIGFWLGGGSVNDSHGVATTELEGLQLPPAG